MKGVFQLFCPPLHVKYRKLSHSMCLKFLSAVLGIVIRVCGRFIIYNILNSPSCRNGYKIDLGLPFCFAAVSSLNAQGMQNQPCVILCKHMLVG